MVASRWAGLLLLELDPPGRGAVKQADVAKSLRVDRHLVLETTALLGEGTDTLMNPFVAVYLVSLVHTARAAARVGHAGRLRRWNGSLADDAINAILKVRSFL